MSLCQQRQAPIHMQSMVIGGSLFDAGTMLPHVVASTYIKLHQLSQCAGFVRDALFERAAAPSTSTAPVSG